MKILDSPAETNVPTQLDPRKCKQSEKWMYRRYKQPISEEDAKRAVEIVLSEYDWIAQLDPYASKEYRYNQKRARIIAAWVTGSSASGRWTKWSDVDIWLQVTGLSDNGYDNLDWHITTNLQEEGKTIITEDGASREIDVLILDCPPSPEYCTIKVDIFT